MDVMTAIGAIIDIWSAMFAGVLIIAGIGGILCVFDPKEDEGLGSLLVALGLIGTGAIIGIAIAHGTI